MDPETRVPSATPTPVVAYDHLLEAHEERLQGLEAVARDTAGKLGVHTHRLDELGVKIDSSVTAIGLKVEESLERALAPLTAGMEGLGGNVRELSGKVGALDSRVGVLETSRAERERLAKEAEELAKARRVKWTALVWTMVGAALTALIKDGIPFFMKLADHWK